MTCTRQTTHHPLMFLPLLAGILIANLTLVPALFAAPSSAPLGKWSQTIIKGFGDGGDPDHGLLGDGGDPDHGFCGGKSDAARGRFDGSRSLTPFQGDGGDPDHGLMGDGGDPDHG